MQPATLELPGCQFAWTTGRMDKGTTRRMDDGTNSEDASFHPDYIWILSIAIVRPASREASLFLYGKDRAGGLDELKNRSGKCEGPGGGVDRVKNRSRKCEGPWWR